MKRKLFSLFARMSAEEAFMFAYGYTELPFRVREVELRLSSSPKWAYKYVRMIALVRVPALEQTIFSSSYYKGRYKTAFRLGTITA